MMGRKVIVRLDGDLVLSHDRSSHRAKGDISAMDMMMGRVYVWLLVLLWVRVWESSILAVLRPVGRARCLLGTSRLLCCRRWTMMARAVVLGQVSQYQVY